MTRRRNFIRTPLLLFVAVILFSLSACRTKVPSRYLSVGKMTDILYDYHLAEVLAERESNDTTAIITYKAYILKKHGVTEADFDSTMYYFSRHTELLHEVYQSLSDRFSNEAMAQGASVSELNQFGSITSNLDTANVWTGKNALLLLPEDAFNSYSFKIKADTSYHKGDAVMLDFDTRFLYQDGMRSATVILAVKHGNDSVTMRTLHISTTSNYHMRIDDKDKLGIKELKGCFILNRDKTNFNATTLKLASIYNIRLIKMHVKEDDKAKKENDEKKDSMSAVKIDTLGKPLPLDTDKVVPLQPTNIPPLKQRLIKK